MRDYVPMMDCVFEQVAPDALQCTRCGYVASKVKPHHLPLRHNCQQPASSPCVHLGAATGTRQCPTCSGNVRVKLFACQVHGETALAKEMEGVACCATCRDYHRLVQPR